MYAHMKIEYFKHAGNNDNGDNDNDSNSNDNRGMRRDEIDIQSDRR